jgi:HEAT repeat protein
LPCIPVWQIYNILAIKFRINPGELGRGKQDMDKIFHELKDKNQPERWTRVIALEKFGKPAVDYLHKALDDEDKWVRYMAADALGNIGDVRSIERLIPLLNDQDQDVRFATAYALGNIGNPSAEKALAQTCSRDNCFVKVAAEEALAKLNSPAKKV